MIVEFEIYRSKFNIFSEEVELGQAVARRYLFNEKMCKRVLRRFMHPNLNKEE